MRDSRATGGFPPAGKGREGFGLDELRRLHAAIGVAHALLDELLQLLPEQPGREDRKAVESVFREIRGLAETGLGRVRKGSGPSGDATEPGQRSRLTPIEE